MYPIYMFTATPDFQISLRVFSRDTCFRVAGHFEINTPNDPNVTLNIKTSKCSNSVSQCVTKCVTATVHVFMLV